MRQGLSPVLWIVAAMVLSALTSFVVTRFADRGTAHAHAGSNGNSNVDFHEWLHAELEITPAQEMSLALIEASFDRQRSVLFERIRLAGKKLASTLEGDPDDASAINASLEEINAAQGELQRVTIAHFLEMKRHLSPSQATLLLQWTRESITHDHGY